MEAAEAAKEEAESRIRQAEEKIRKHDDRPIYSVVLSHMPIHVYRVFIKYCVFFKILKYSGLLPFSVFPRCQCVYTHQAGRTPALQQSWQSLEKFRNFKEKTQ